MTSQQIRDTFFEFFSQNGHDYGAPSPLWNKDDPSLLFVNSGMVQFKGLLLGDEKPRHPQVYNSQPCLRVSGKHNDLEDVGIDTYHHTLFEMLGHWSFGAYFKEGAVDYAWRLLTDTFGLPKDRLYATIFGGSKEDRLPLDREAYQLWRRYLPKEQILKGSKADNFWEMGSQGPCGPCTEVHIDLRSEAERRAVPGAQLVNQDHPHVIEIGNWVFIQHQRMANGKLSGLPKKHIDNGIGFERLCMVLQGKQSTYDTDLFTPILDTLGQKTGVAYGKSEETDVAMRVVADHLRALTFTMAQGLLPSSHKEGYVIRRILRRAVHYGYRSLGLQKPFLYELIPTVNQTLQKAYPLLAQRQEQVQEAIQQEESKFLSTLSKGVKHFFDITQRLPAEEKQISGQSAFTLYDTYGFPYDLTALMARQGGYTLDEAGFQEAMTQQKMRSRESAEEEVEDWTLVKKGKSSQFVGYDHLKVDTWITKYRRVVQKGEDYYQVVLEKTPFYPEGGGQVGDRGVLQFGDDRIDVLDTQRENKEILHYVEWLPQYMQGNCHAQVDPLQRADTAKNHSATHLLHAALRQFLGDHVVQRGSYVGPQRLRFDFDHPTQIETSTLQHIEKAVNEKIRANLVRRESRDISMKEAKQMGAMALFTEKYGNKVRVISFGDSHSVELCGGTHVAATGEIGYCKIVSEKSIATGVRRIEALTGAAVDEWLHSKENEEQQIIDLLGHVEWVPAIRQLVAKKKSLQKQLDAVNASLVKAEVETLISRIGEGEAPVTLIEKVKTLDASALKKIAFTLQKNFPDTLIMLVAPLHKKEVSLVIAVPKSLQEKWHAGELMKKFLPYIEGEGGGSAHFGYGVGQQQGLDALLTAARNALRPADRSDK